MGRRHRTALVAVLALGAGCAVVNPVPTASAPRPDFRLLVDIGIFGGPPEPIPPYHIIALNDDTLLVAVDRGASQRLREVRWNGAAWEVLAGADGELIPPGEDGPYLRTLAISTDDGFSTDASVLLARVPDGPIQRIELLVNGAIDDVSIDQRPIFARVYPAGTEFGSEFTGFDLGTHELYRGEVHHH